MSDYDEFEAWSTPKSRKSRKNRKKDAKRVNVYPRLAGGIDEIPQMLGKEPLAAEDRPEEERMTRERAEALAGEILGWLEPVTDYAEVAGSYRRGRQDPGDLDVIVILKNRVKLPEIAELWLAEGKASAVNWVGEKKTQLLIDGVKVDIRTSTPRALGAALLYFTGPAGYNIGIRSAAKRAGFKLSEYGLFNRETGEYIAGATEEDIYTAMGRNYRPPTERRAEENVSFATEENNEMQEAIIRGLRNLARDGYVVAAPPYGNRSRNFYQYLSTEIMSELAELGSDDEGPEVTGSGRAIDPYNVVRSLARNQSFSMPDNELSVGIADMVMSFTQQSTVMDEQDGFIPPEGYTQMVFDLPDDGLITRRLAFPLSHAMGIYGMAGRRLFLHSTPQKNRNCSMIINMLIEDLQPEVSGMTDSEKEQFYQAFGREILRQLDYWNGPIQEEYYRNQEWKRRNHGDTTIIDAVTVRDDIRDRAVTAAQRLNPFSAESFGAEYEQAFDISMACPKCDKILYPIGEGGDRKSEDLMHFEYYCGCDEKPKTWEMSIANPCSNCGDRYDEWKQDFHPITGRFNKNATQFWTMCEVCHKGFCGNGTVYSNQFCQTQDMVCNDCEPFNTYGKYRAESFGAETWDAEFRQFFPMKDEVKLHYVGTYIDEEDNEEQEVEGFSWVSKNDYIRFYEETAYEPCQCDERGCLSCFLDETNGWAKGFGMNVFLLWFGKDENGEQWDYPPKNAESFGAETYTPPASAVKAAKRGLEQRKKYGRGGLSPAEAKSQGIDSGVTRARKIASGKVSKHDVRRMSAFNRHRKNNNPGKKMPDGGPTAGTIAWNLWGGSAGVNWAKKKSAAMNAETQEFADRFEIQIRTSRGNTTERIPVGRSMVVRRLREILGRNRQPYAIDVFGTEAAFNVMGPYGMQVYRPKPKLLAVYKYGQFESGEMADHLNEKLGL